MVKVMLMRVYGFCGFLPPSVFGWFWPLESSHRRPGSWSILCAVNRFVFEGCEFLYIFVV